MKIIFILIGFIFGIIFSLFMISKRTQAVLEVDFSNKEKPRALFVLKIPYDDIFKYKRIKVDIKDVTQLVKNNENADNSIDIIGGMNNGK